MNLKEIKIEKGIPIPDFNTQYGSFAFKIKSMEIGDSFVCDMIKRPGIPSLFKRKGMKCVTRKESGTTVRVWRTA